MLFFSLRLIWYLYLVTTKNAAVCIILHFTHILYGEITASFYLFQHNSPNILYVYSPFIVSLKWPTEPLNLLTPTKLTNQQLLQFSKGANQLRGSEQRQGGGLNPVHSPDHRKVNVCKHSTGLNNYPKLITIKLENAIYLLLLTKT